MVVENMSENYATSKIDTPFPAAMKRVSRRMRSKLNVICW
jgi:hypothetical protein